MQRVLVLATGNPVMELAQIAAGNEVHLLAPVSVLAGELAPGLAGTSAVHNWDDYRELDAIACELPDIDAIATIDEQAIRAAGFLTDRLGLSSGYTFGQAVAATDKHVMKTQLSRAGIPVARHRLVRNAAGVREAAHSLGYPVVVKPRTGMGALHTHFVYSDRHLSELIAAGEFDTPAADASGRFTASSILAPLSASRSGFMVEEAVEVLTEYYCDLLIHDSRVVAAAPGTYSPAPIKLKPGLTVFSMVMYAPELARPGVAEMSASAAAALGLKSGHAHCEVFDTPRGLVFGEIAFRGGGAALADMMEELYGIDMPAVEAALTTGRDPETEFIAQHKAIAVTYFIPPKDGIISAIHGLDQARAHPGMLRDEIALKVGEPTPGWFADIPLTGCLIYAIQQPARAEEEAELLGKLVTITVQAGGSASLPAPAARSHAGSRCAW
jgi:hypothetical protein